MGSIKGRQTRIELGKNGRHAYCANETSLAKDQSLTVIGGRRHHRQWQQHQAVVEFGQACMEIQPIVKGETVALKIVDHWLGIPDLIEAGTELHVPRFGQSSNLAELFQNSV